jgi:hypothetical protein
MIGNGSESLKDPINKAITKTRRSQSAPTVGVVDAFARTTYNKQYARRSSCSAFPAFNRELMHGGDMPIEVAFLVEICRAREWESAGGATLIV